MCRRSVAPALGAGFLGGVFPFSSELVAPPLPVLLCCTRLTCCVFVTDLFISVSERVFLGLTLLLAVEYPGGKSPKGESDARGKYFASGLDILPLPFRGDLEMRVLT